MTLDPKKMVLAADLGLASFRADPIAAFRFSSQAQRDATRALSLFQETVLRAPNRGGKTMWAAHAFVGISRGCTELDGVALPVLGTPCHGLVLAKGREMSKLSAIQAYKDAIGDWPHHIEKNGNVIAALWVKPNRSKSDDWNDWSSIRFFVEDGQSLAGMRLDWAHGDEPPSESDWMELRMRGRANRHFVRCITFTPIDKREWAWLRAMLRGCEWPRGKDGRVEIIMRHMRENTVLSAADIQQAEYNAKGKLAKAKLEGEYVDLTGSNPFDPDGLARWAERCTPGTKVPFDAGGLTHTWESWNDHDPAEEYFVICDPSQGIEDERGEHDPCEAIVLSRRHPRLIARYNGYLTAHELGRLAASMGHRYGYAMVVWERNSGYGESFFHGLGGYGNVYIEHHRDSLALTLSQRIGWSTNASTRGTIIGALQEAIKQDTILVQSAECVESLKNVIVNRLNRIEAGPGAHDEDMIVLGLGAHLLQTLPIYDFRKNGSGSDAFIKEAGLRRRINGQLDPFDTT